MYAMRNCYYIFNYNNNKTTTKLCLQWNCKEVLFIIQTMILIDYADIFPGGVCL